MWLTKLKIAIVEENTEKLSNLIQDIPKLDDVKDMREALCLVEEALTLLHRLKSETSTSMKQIKKNLAFLKSTHTQSISKLDIKS